MRILKYGILVLLLVGTAGAGCARHAAAARKHSLGMSPAEPTWGPAIEGLQCRLRPMKRVCATGESPTFTLDLRNQGARIFAFPSGGEAPVDRFSIDDRWRPWPERPPKDGKVRPLSPGVSVTDMPVVLPPGAHSFLTPGSHTIRFAFSFEGVEVVSNPVEIEIVGSR